MNVLTRVALVLELVATLGLIGAVTPLLVRAWRDRRLDAQGGPVRAAIVHGLVSKSEADIDSIMALPLRWRVETLVGLAGILGPADRAAIRDLAEQIGRAHV